MALYFRFRPNIHCTGARAIGVVVNANGFARARLIRALCPCQKITERHTHCGGRRHQTKAERIRICFKLRVANGDSAGRCVPNIALHGSA